MRKSLKICQVCAVDFTLKRLLLPLIDAQIKNGHKVTAVASYGEYTDSMKKSGYNIQSIPIARSLSLAKAIKSIWLLTKFLKTESFDVVHVHTPVAAVIGRIAAFFARVPLVIYTAHGFYFHENMPAPKKTLYIIIELLMRPFTDLLFTQSAEDAESAQILKIMGKKKIFNIGNGVNTDIFNPENIHTTDALKYLENKIVIGMVSRIVREKGIIEFLQVAQRLASIYPNLIFVLVGSRLKTDHNSNVNGAVDEAARKLGGALIITGERDDVAAIMANMDIFCLPSWREGMPRSIIEAMMMRLPVVASKIRGCREEVVHGETGLLVPARNVEALHEALKTLVDHPEMRVKYGVAGRMRALRLYDERKVIEQQLQIMETHFNQNEL